MDCVHSSALLEIQNTLNGRSLVAQVHSKNGDDIALVLHDTSTDKDVNLNEVRLG